MRPLQNKLELPKAAVLTLVLVLPATLISAGMSPALAATSIGVFDPDSSPYGKTYGEWSADWWTCAVNTGFAAFSDTPESCNVGQTEPVWFLAGTFGGSAERICTV